MHERALLVLARSPASFRASALASRPCFARFPSTLGVFQGGRLGRRVYRRGVHSGSGFQTRILYLKRAFCPSPARSLGELLFSRP